MCEDNIVGITWNDSSDKSLAEKMTLAVGRYKSRMGGDVPDVVEIHPDDYPEIKDGFVIAGMIVRRSPCVLVGHYFLTSEK